MKNQSNLQSQDQSDKQNMLDAISQNDLANKQENLNDEIAESSMVIPQFVPDSAENLRLRKTANKKSGEKQTAELVQSSISLSPAINDKKIVEFSDIKEKIELYLKKHQIKQITKAYELCKFAHQGQKRNSGEDYYHHPLAVALILADMRADYVSVSAALLHDVVEDTKISLAYLKQEFGDEVAEIVDGVSKLGKFKFSSVQNRNAENFLKMVLAMCKDVRVMLVKVTDRLHNMRTLETMPVEKQRKKAQETLEIYAPISMRLGLSQIQYELEDLGLKYLYPDRYRVLNEKILEVTGGRKHFVQDVEKAIKELLAVNKIPCTVVGRKKNLYSLYKKMRYKRVSFDQIEDTYAFRVIVKDVATCYQVLGLIHSFYSPIPKTVEDYIAMPKLNGYQSIHTEVVASFGVRIEVQLRTEEMNQIAEYGVAAHWRYKAKGANIYEQNARKWLSRVLETKEASEDPLDFMEKMKMDLQPHEVYVLSPKGEIFRMPYDSIGVDLAFAIHTDIGLKAKSMIVNGNHCPITQKIVSGQRIEIVTSDSASVNFKWIYLVKTPRAKNAISHYFKKINKTNFEDLKELGESILESALAKTTHLKFEDLSEGRINLVLNSLNLMNSDELFVEIAKGRLVAKTVAKSLLKSNVFSRVMRTLKIKKKVIETKNYTVSAQKEPLAQFARCCGPIPGDEIVAEIRPEGFMVHRKQCKTLLKKLSKFPDQFVSMQWDENANQFTYRTSFGVIVKNNPDAFSKIVALMGDSNVDVENIRHTSFNYRTKLISCIVWAHSITELDDLMKAIGSHLFVKSVDRVK